MRQAEDSVKGWVQFGDRYRCGGVGRPHARATERTVTSGSSRPLKRPRCDSLRFNTCFSAICPLVITASDWEDRFSPLRSQSARQRTRRGSRSLPIPTHAVDGFDAKVDWIRSYVGSRVI